jgi:hypothetical protein
VRNLADLGEIPSRLGRPAGHCILLGSNLTCTFTNTSPKNPDQHIIKQNIRRSNGSSHGLMGPHAASILVFMLQTASLSNIHVLINKAVQRRAERSQSQAGRPLTVEPQTDATTSDLRRRSGASTRRAVTGGNIPRPSQPRRSRPAWPCSATLTPLRVEVTQPSYLRVEAKHMSKY